MEKPMALQVRSVSEPTYEEDGVHYGTPTNMIEKIKELQLKIEDMEDEIHRLTTGFSKKWNDVAYDDLKSADYLTKFDKKFDEYGYYGENNGPIEEHSSCGTDDCCKQC